MPRGGKRIKGSADERSRARERLRMELLTAARTLGEEYGGYEKVTIRKVADQVGYTAPVVYEHFAGKQALLFGVVEQGYADLADELGRAQCADVQRHAGGALEAVAQTYWTFATDRPHLYRLMSTLAEVPFGTPDTPAAARDCFRLLKAAVTADARDTIADATYDEDAATDLFWAHVHGLIALTLEGRIKGGHARAHQLLRQLVDVHRRWLGTDPPA